MYKKNQKTWHKHFDFMMLDLLCMEISFLIAFVIRFGVRQVDALLVRTDFSIPYREMFVVILCLHIAFILFTQPYSGILRRNSAEELKKVIQYNLWILAGMVFILFAKQESKTYSRLVIGYFPVVDILLMMFYRYFHKKTVRRSINKENRQDLLLLVAPYRQVSGILHNYYKNKVSTTKITGIILSDSEEELKEIFHDEKEVLCAEENASDSVDTVITGAAIRGIPIVGALDNMYEYARTNVVDEVLISADNLKVEEIAEKFMDMGITVHVSIQNIVQIPKAMLNRINGIPVITSCVNTITDRQLLIKRIIDIFFGLLGSIVTILLMIIIAPMMLIADPGPLFFRQERVGKNGRTFKIWKFRTMYKDAEARKAELMAQNKMSGLMFKMDDDPRIIGYGKKFSLGEFLRKTSIDELPQSFNILAGSMSVVGTRPPTVKEYEQYDLHHKGRLATKPGLTGMWQVSGRSNITDFEEVVRLDKEYIDNFSLMLDLEIMIKTVKVVLGKEGSV